MNVMLSDKKWLCIIIILLFHLVGLIGFILPSLNVLFMALVHWHLLLMLAVVIYSHDSLNRKFAVFALITACAGIIAELIGVHTGWLFGNYNYGGTLGWKLFEVPLLIGVNWFLLVYSAGVTLKRSRIGNKYLRVITGAAILTLLDVLIEPIAIRFDYWHWAGGMIPIKNYVCWFLVSGVLLFVFEKFEFKRQSIVATVLLVTQFVFFAVLNLVY